MYAHILLYLIVVKSNEVTIEYAKYDLQMRNIQVL